MRARMHSALGITGQSLGSGDARRVQWANHTTAATTRSRSRRDRPPRPDARKDHPMTRDLKSLGGGGSSMSSVSEDIKPVDDVPVTFINVFEVSVEQIDRFIARWRERAKIMSAAPGFRPRSCGWRRSPRLPDERPGCPRGADRPGKTEMPSGFRKTPGRPWQRTPGRMRGRTPMAASPRERRRRPTRPVRRSRR